MRRATLKGWFLLALLALLAGGCVTGPTSRRAPPVVAATERPAHNLRVLERISELVQARFYDEKLHGLDWPAVIARFRPDVAKAKDDPELYEVLNRLLDEFKASHIVAISPQEAFQNGRAQTARIGLRSQGLNGTWVVCEVAPGSAAALAGVKPGWLVLKINGYTMNEERPPLRDGQEVPVEFIDEHDEPRNFVLKAQMISTAPRFESGVLPGGILYLRFDEFAWNTPRWISEQLKTHPDAPATIIDLRMNPGGFELSLRFAISEFFPGWMPIGSFTDRGKSGKDAESFAWRSARYPGRVVILVSNGSASCSEIFTHVLQYHGRAMVVGQKTNGSVIVSRFFGLPGGGRLQVPVSDYHGLDGKRLEGIGVMPDVIVVPKLADLRAGLDMELEAALAELKKK